MKLTFLLQLFVLGFFLEVVLTSPLVVRDRVPGCGTSSSLECRIVNVSPAPVTFPNPCDPFVRCYYYSNFGNTFCEDVDSA
ncbi:36406_t:CDS:1, partial [Racocetra persica]